MQLVRLEMKGFKSFADKTIVTFSPGMTGIVGPNGSGKSNITDAIRWVLGESNVRHLRGQKAEDIIFSGTEARRQQSTAEVSLVFDNKDHTLGEELAEVVITRRIYRSGESEFLVNQRACRLKDIHLLLADTGLGKDSMAIIGQNRIDAILNSKPEERRLIFEDVAGISKFKLNKEDALRRIHSTERNMERLTDLMSTLQEQLVELEAKANETREYNRLGQEKRQYDAAIAFHEYKTADRLFTRQENENLSFLREAEELDAMLEAATKDYEKIQQSLQGIREHQRELEEAYGNTQGELGTLTGELNVIKMKQQNLEQSMVDVQDRIRLLRNQEVEEASTLEQVRQEVLEIQSHLTKAQEDVESKERSLLAIRTSMTSVQQELSHERKEDQTSHERQLELVRQVETQRSTLERILEKAASRSDEQHRLAQSVEDSARSIEELQATLGVQQQVVSDQEKRLQQARQELQFLEENRQKAQAEWESVQQRRQHMQGRLELLQNWEDLHEGYLEGTKHVLSAKELWSSSMLGAVGDLFTVEERYLTAIETALGGSIHQVVTASAKAASQAVQYLKRTQGGRVTFLPLDTVRGKRQEHAALQESTVLGLAVDCISFEEQYRSIFTQLLGRTLVVDTLEEGLALQKRYHQQLRIVTLGGEQLQPGGALTGGATKRKKVSILSRREEKEQLQADLSSLSIQVNELRDTMAHYAKESEEKIKQGQVLRDTYAESALTLREQEAMVRRRQEEYQALQQLDGTLREELLSLEKERQTLEGRLQELETDLLTVTDVTVRTETIDRLIKREQVLQQEERQASDALQQARLTGEQWRLTLGQLKEKETGLIHHLEEIHRQLTAEQERIQTLQQELEDALPEELADTEQRRQDLECQLMELRSRREEGAQAITSKETELGRLQEQKYQGEQRQRVVQKKLLDLQEGLANYRLQGEKALETLEYLGYTKQEAQDIRRKGSIADWKREQVLLVQAMNDLGVVNPNAITDYEEALEKVAFYEVQHEDLSVAKGQLETVIAEIDDAMAGQLQEVLTVIRSGFQDVFSQLFGGGTAQIVVSDPTSILESGIDFIIQPPGKKRQQLSLLSGGERALTVIALLFALLQYRPAPFCVLDEVDAALDDANVERFSQYLQSLGTTTQFIVVTHRKRTMESAHVLQGVTMVERGVSRLLTVAFDEVKENSEYGT